MTTRAQWKLPVALFTGGAVTMLLLVLLTPLQQQLHLQVRTVLIFGLTYWDWYFVALIVCAIVAIAGMWVGTSRLGSARRTRPFAVVLGFLTAAGIVVVVMAGFVGWVFLGWTERTEIPLAHGKSIVVWASFFHHCDLTITQRAGIYVDTELGYFFDKVSCQAFGKGDYTVEQHGDVVTLSTGSQSVTVTLQAAR